MIQSNEAGIVIIYGAFDMFHVGHVNILRRARHLGGRLIVGVSTDEFIVENGKQSLFPFEERKLILESCKYVDLVIPEMCWEQKIEDVERHQVSTFVSGNDCIGQFDYLNPYCKVVYLERTPKISTTYYRNSMADLINS